MHTHTHTHTRAAMFRCVATWFSVYLATLPARSNLIISATHMRSFSLISLRMLVFIICTRQCGFSAVLQTALQILLHRKTAGAVGACLVSIQCPSSLKICTSRMQATTPTPQQYLCISEHNVYAYIKHVAHRYCALIRCVHHNAYVQLRSHAPHLCALLRSGAEIAELPSTHTHTHTRTHEHSRMHIQPFAMPSLTPALPLSFEHVTIPPNLPPPPH